jgi:hypothetical protein
MAEQGSTSLDPGKFLVGRVGHRGAWIHGLLRALEVMKCLGHGAAVYNESGVLLAWMAPNYSVMFEPEERGTAPRFETGLGGNGAVEL